MRCAKRYQVNSLKPNHRGAELRQPKDQKRLADKRTKAAGVFGKLMPLLPGLSEVTLAKLVELMGKDGLQCLSSRNPSLEFSVLIYNRYREFLKTNNYNFTTTTDVKREAERRTSKEKLSQEDIKRLSELLVIIFDSFTEEKRLELSKIIAKDVLKIIWAKDALFGLKKYCLENQRDWLNSNGVNTLEMVGAISKNAKKEEVKSTPSQVKAKHRSKSKKKKRMPQYDGK